MDEFLSYNRLSMTICKAKKMGKITLKNVIFYKFFLNATQCVAVFMFAEAIRTLFFVESNSCLDAECQLLPGAVILLGRVSEMNFHECIELKGLLDPCRHTFVTATCNGTVDAIMAGEGDLVQKGKSRLFAIDSRMPRQQVELAKVNLITTYAILEENRDILSRTEKRLAKAEKEVEWLCSFCTDCDTVGERLALATSIVETLAAQRKCDQSIVEICKSKVAEAETAMLEAVKKLEKTYAYAPADGVIAASLVQLGQTVTRDEPMMWLDEHERLRVVVNCPERHYERIEPGATMVEISVDGTALGEYPVLFKGEEISSRSMTFEFGTEIAGDGKTVIAGAVCSIKARIRTTRGLGVHKDAVYLIDGQQYVFVPDGPGAKIVNVDLGLETDGWVQLLNPPLFSGDRVIIEDHVPAYATMLEKNAAV